MKKVLLFFAAAILIIAGWILWRHNSSQEAGGAKQADTASFNKQTHSLVDPASIWIIVNKHRQLQPKEYIPNDLVTPNVALRLTNKDEEMRLREEAAHALEELFTAAKKDGLSLMVSSAYRSYAFQKGLYNRYVGQQGQATADTQSARPGYSEHQTGLAVDVEPASRKCEVEACFADTPEGQWAAKNSHFYGFIIRYGEDNQAVTGYIYEPWHLRYVGRPLAQELYKKGNPALEEFFNTGVAPDYE